MEDVDPNAFGSPSDKAIVERLSRPVDLRGIDPAAAGLEDMDDAANRSAVIDSWLAARVGWQQRLRPRNLLPPSARNNRDSSVASLWRP